MKKLGSAIAGVLTGAAAGTAASMWVQQKIVGQKDKKIDKFKGYYQMLDQWLSLKQRGGNLSTYFADNGYHKIAIYGLGEMGDRLIDELKESGIEVVYGIDKEAYGALASTFPVCSLDELEETETVDAVVVTAIFAFDEIVEQLSDLVMCPIVSLEDIVYEVEM